MLVLVTACGSTAPNSGPFTVKEVTVAFAKQGFTLVPTPPNMLGDEAAIALSQKPLTGTVKGHNLALHAQDFVVFVFSKIATVNSARTRAAAAAFARNSLGKDYSLANLVVVWEVRPDNGGEVARIKQAIHSLQG